MDLLLSLAQARDVTVVEQHPDAGTDGELLNEDLEKITNIRLLEDQIINIRLLEDHLESEYQLMSCVVITGKSSCFLQLYTFICGFLSYKHILARNGAFLDKMHIFLYVFNK